MGAAELIPLQVSSDPNAFSGGEDAEVQSRLLCPVAHMLRLAGHVMSGLGYRLLTGHGLLRQTGSETQAC